MADITTHSWVPVVPLQSQEERELQETYQELAGLIRNNPNPDEYRGQTDQFEEKFSKTKTNKDQIKKLIQAIETRLGATKFADTIAHTPLKTELNYLKLLLEARLKENKTVKNDSPADYKRSSFANRVESNLTKGMNSLNKDNRNDNTTMGKQLANTARGASVVAASAIGTALTKPATLAAQWIYKADPDNIAKKTIINALKKENKAGNIDALCCHLSSKVAVAQVLDEGNQAEKKLEELEGLRNISNKRSNELKALQPTLTKRVAARNELKAVLNARAQVLKKSRSECNKTESTAKDLLNPHASGAQRYRLTLSQMKEKNAGPTTDAALKKELIQLLNESSDHLRQTNHITQTDADQTLYTDLKGDESDNQIGNRIKKIQDKHLFHLNDALQEKWLEYSAMPSTYLPPSSDLKNALSRAREAKLSPHRNAIKAHEEMTNNPWLKAIFALDQEHQAEAFKEMKSEINKKLSVAPESPLMPAKKNVTFTARIKKYSDGEERLITDTNGTNPACDAKKWRDIVLQKIALKALEHLSKEKFEALFNETANKSPDATGQQRRCLNWMKKSTPSVSPKLRLDRLKKLLGGQEAYDKLFKAKDTVNTCNQIIENLNNIHRIGDQITTLKEEIDSANTEDQEKTEEKTEEKTQENTEKYHQLRDEYNTLVKNTNELVKEARDTNSDALKSIDTTNPITHEHVASIITENKGDALKNESKYFQDQLKTNKGEVDETIGALKNNPDALATAITDNKPSDDEKNSLKQPRETRGGEIEMIEPSSPSL